ncbi:MAG: hypothetical protein J6N56_03790 [Bacteroidales bacterium]|nr:hypothetical protein [Bacteroidales bacterium]
MISSHCSFFSNNIGKNYFSTLDRFFKKLILFLLFIIVKGVCYANDYNYKITYKSGIYAEFDTETRIFSALIDNPIYVNTSDLECFIHSLYQNNIYIYTRLYSYYFKMYGIKRNVGEAAEKEMSLFEEQKEKKQRHRTIILKNGKRIKVEYLYISGFFMSFSAKENKDSYSTNGIAYPYYHEITTVYIPIHIIYYKKSNKLRIKKRI